jgi:hypothetical protein
LVDHAAMDLRRFQIRVDLDINRVQDLFPTEKMKKLSETLDWHVANTRSHQNYAVQDNSRRSLDGHLKKGVDGLAGIFVIPVKAGIQFDWTPLPNPNFVGLFCGLFCRSQNETPVPGRRSKPLLSSSHPRNCRTTITWWQRSSPNDQVRFPSLARRAPQSPHKFSLGG